MKLRTLCATCQWEGEKCNVTNKRVDGIIIECGGYVMRDYVSVDNFIE